MEAQTLDCNFKRLASVSMKETFENFREASIRYRRLISVCDVLCNVKVLDAGEDVFVDTP